LFVVTIPLFRFSIPQAFRLLGFYKKKLYLLPSNQKSLLFSLRKIKT